MVSDEEGQVADLLGSTHANPLAFVRRCFDWGYGDLEGFDGPDEWQTEFLIRLGEAIRDREPGEAIKMVTKTGKGPGKTAMEAWLILWLMSTRPNLAGFAMANTGDQLDSKLWRELALWHRRAINAHWFTWTATRFFANEAKETWGVDAVKWSENRPDAMGGLHNAGRGQVAIVDEGSGVPAAIYDTIDSTMTDPDSFVFVFGNPYRKSGRFYELFTRFAHRWITMTVDCRKARAPNQRKIQQDIEDYGLNSDYVRINIRGEFPEVDDNTLIPLHLIESAKLREVADQSRYRPCWGVDVARFGDDRTVVVERRGKIVQRKTVWRGIDTMQTAGRINAMWSDALPDDRPSAIMIDSIGVGGGVVDRLREFDGVGSVVRGINVSESPAVKAKFPKLRDELYWKGREWFEGLDVSCKDDEIGGELADVLYSYTSAGQIKIERKDEIKERLGRSPDVGEAFLLSLASQDVLLEKPMDRYERARLRSEASGGSAWAS